eukprot:TRINITY_DN90564_c0_g1_i1.p1 TRINITY_DN90564_c0_g1~~TRINITY_DN90564_c0_g1_i1.p1  ORF type:complete len:464 (+),score=70.52 TRINITY_DN90564_c0_g1_i1:122-1513(+)
MTHHHAISELDREFPGKHTVPAMPLALTLPDSHALSLFNVQPAAGLTIRKVNADRMDDFTKDQVFKDMKKEMRDKERHNRLESRRLGRTPSTFKPRPSRLYEEAQLLPRQEPAIRDRRGYNIGRKEADISDLHRPGRIMQFVNAHSSNLAGHLCTMPRNAFIGDEVVRGRSRVDPANVSRPAGIPSTTFIESIPSFRGEGLVHRDAIKFHRPLDEWEHIMLQRRRALSEPPDRPNPITQVISAIVREPCYRFDFQKNTGRSRSPDSARKLSHNLSTPSDMWNFPDHARPPKPYNFDFCPELKTPSTSYASSDGSDSPHVLEHPRPAFIERDGRPCRSGRPRTPRSGLSSASSPSSWVSDVEKSPSVTSFYEHTNHELMLKKEGVQYGDVDSMYWRTIEAKFERARRTLPTEPARLLPLPVAGTPSVSSRGGGSAAGCFSDIGSLCSASALKGKQLGSRRNSCN